MIQIFGGLCVAPKFIPNTRLSGPGYLLKLCSFVNYRILKMFSGKTSTYVALPDVPVYLTPHKTETAKLDVSTNLKKSQFMTRDYDLYLLQPEAEDTENVPAYIKTGITSQKIIRNLPQFNGGYSLCYSYDACHDLTVKSDQTTDSAGLCRGVFIYMNKSDPQTDQTRSEILQIAKEHGFNVFSQFHYLPESPVLVKKVFNMTKGNVLIEEKEYSCSNAPLSNCCGDEQQTSAIFNTTVYMPVFHSYSRTRDILQKCSDIPEVEELLSIADKHIPDYFNLEEMNSNMKHPFIVVEGMDATGKTTLTKTLEEKLQAARYFTPPPPLEALRKYFDALPELIRRAYYSLGNYIVAIEISKECSDRAVIMDRYWHSTAAYGIANECSTGDCPASGHAVYQWPEDLLKPTLVLFLTVSEEIRKQRLHGRGIEKTFEEKNLDRDQLFRQRLCTAYRRMEKPACREIDASGTAQEVVDAAILKLKDSGIDLQT